MENKLKIIVLWVVKFIILFYAIESIFLWVDVINPDFYEKYLSNPIVYEVLNNISMIGFLMSMILIILQMVRIIKMEWKLFFIMLLLLISNILLVYLDIRKNGDS